MASSEVHDLSTPSSATHLSLSQPSPSGDALLVLAECSIHASRSRSQHPGRRIIRSRTYDSDLGVSCHWCRQKTVEEHVRCRRCTVAFCGGCLRNRHGELIDIEMQNYVHWVCPKCRGGCGEGCTYCCNCGPCRKAQGLEPTGLLVHAARACGFTNVHDYLIHKITGESQETIAERKRGKGWCQTVELTPITMRNIDDGSEKRLKKAKFPTKSEYTHMQEHGRHLSLGSFLQNDRHSNIPYGDPLPSNKKKLYEATSTLITLSQTELNLHRHDTPSMQFEELVLSSSLKPIPEISQVCAGDNTRQLACVKAEAVEYGSRQLACVKAETVEYGSRQLACVKAETVEYGSFSTFPEKKGELCETWNPLASQRQRIGVESVGEIRKVEEVHASSISSKYFSCLQAPKFSLLLPGNGQNILSAFSYDGSQGNAISSDTISMSNTKSQMGSLNIVEKTFQEPQGSDIVAAVVKNQAGGQGGNKTNFSPVENICSDGDQTANPGDRSTCLSHLLAKSSKEISDVLVLNNMKEKVKHKDHIFSPSPQCKTNAIPPFRQFNDQQMNFVNIVDGDNSSGTSEVLDTGMKKTGFQRKLADRLSEPFDVDELEFLIKALNYRQPLYKPCLDKVNEAKFFSSEKFSCLDHHPDLAKKLQSSTNPEFRLSLLRGFLFWLQHSRLEDAFKPWLLQRCDYLRKE